MRKFKTRGKRRRRGFVGKKRNSRKSRRKIINRYTVSRGGIRL